MLRYHDVQAKNRYKNSFSIKNSVSFMAVSFEEKLDIKFQASVCARLLVIFTWKQGFEKWTALKKACLRVAIEFCIFSHFQVLSPP